MDCFGCISKDSYNEMNTIGSSKNIVIKNDMSRTDVVENVVVSETVLPETVTKEVVIETIVHTEAKVINDSNKVEETKDFNEEVDNELDIVIIDNRVTLTHPIIYNDSYMSQ